MNLLYNITFSPVSIFCALNSFESMSSPNTLFSEEKTISAIHLLPVSLSCFHPLYPNFLISKTSSLRNGHPLDLVDAFFLILIAGSAFMSSTSILKFFLLSYALSPHILYLYHISLLIPLLVDQTFLYHMYISFRYSE
jgi:hypothetical protein